MSKEDVYALSAECGIPMAHMFFPEGSAPPLPWTVFFLDEENGLYADDRVYAHVERWTLELYQRSSDSQLEERLEAAIERAFGPYSKEESWVEKENCLLTAYTFTCITRKDVQDG